MISLVPRGAHRTGRGHAWNPAECCRLGPGILLYNRHTGARVRALAASPGPAEAHQEASAALAAAQAALAALDADVARYSRHFGAGCCSRR